MALRLIFGVLGLFFQTDFYSCIIMEFYTKYAIFQGRTEIDQLDLIFKLCGTPTEESWPAISQMPWNGLFNFSNYERVLKKEFKSSSYGLTDQFIDLLDQLLTVNPEKRPTALGAMQHPFFTEEEPKACKPNE